MSGTGKDTFKYLYGGKQNALFYADDRDVFTQQEGGFVAPTRKDVRTHNAVGNFGFGQRVQIPLNNVGDVLKGMYLKVKFTQPRYNNLTSDFGTPASGFNSDPRYTLCWKNNLGYQIVDKCTFEIGSHQLQEIRGRPSWIAHELAVLDEHKHRDRDVLMFRDMTAPQVEEEMKERWNDEHEIYVPLDFVFNATHAKALRTVNIGDLMYVYVTVPKLEDLIYHTQNVVTGWNQSTPTTAPFNINLLDVKISSIELVTNFYQLLDKIAETHQDLQMRILGSYPAFQEDIVVAPGATEVTVDINVQNVVGYTAFLIEDHSMPVDVNDFFSNWSDRLRDVEIKMNNISILDKDVYTGNYIKNIHMHEHFVNDVEEYNIFAISWAENPLSLIPTGSCNFENGNTKKMTIRFGKPDGSASEPMANGGLVHVYHWYWDFIIYDGKGRVRRVLNT